jgi:hypothetical protein
MKANQFNKLESFLEKLDDAKIDYHILHTREEAVSVLAFAPGEYWEIDFLKDGEVEVERFRSTGHLDDESALKELFALWSDSDNPGEVTEKENATAARK